MYFFYKSPFFEMESCNGAIIHQGKLVTKEMLIGAKGIQFVVSQCFSERLILWIEKRLRTSETQFQVISVYYMVNFCIF